MRSDSNTAAAHRSRRPPSRATGGKPGTGVRLQRFLQAGATPANVDEASRTVELSFSSDTPVDRWFGQEVLSHAPGCADLTRLNNGAPLLFNHDLGDVLGVVESAAIGADGKGRAVVRLGRDERGEWALQQIADGILCNVSFAYVVNRYADPVDADETDPTTADVYTATRWTALEISIVTVPADPSVGVGRSFHFKDTTMDQDLIDNDTDTTQRASRRQRALNAAEDERERVLAIQGLCRRNGVPELADRFIANGTSLQEARGTVLAHQTSRAGMARPVGSLAPTSGEGGYLGMTDGEARRFSLVRAINAIVSNDWRDAGFERECSQAVAQQLGRPPAARAFFVPNDVQQRTPWSMQTRATYQVGTPGQGGNLVQTQLLADHWVDALRNASQVLNAGATVLSGLVGNVDIPRRITTTSTGWVAESGALTESEATFDKISLRPKTLGAFAKMSRLMLLQSTPHIEMITRSDLMMQMGLGIDLAALSGSGASNQPTGIANMAGIGAVIGGTNGLAVTMDQVIQLESALSNANAPWDTRGYVFNTKTIATLKTQKASTGAYIWTAAANGGRSGTPPDINGYPLLPSNQARSTLTKGTSSGVCSELFYGAWSELFIAQWGALEIIVNPYDSTGFMNGDVLIRAMQTCDISAKHAGSFAVMSDALTP